MAHLTLLLVLLWVGTTVSTVVDVDKRIIGGQNCKDDERLYHVQLEISNGTYEYICGGSLINDRWILSVAHCWEEGFDISAILGVHPGRGKTVKITTKPKIYEKRHFISKKSHDIMLLELPEGTQIPPGVQTVNPADCKATPPLPALVQIAGHTVLPPGQNNLALCSESQTLQCADINVVDCRVVRQFLKDTESDHQHWFCGRTRGVSACHGDSGGGVVYEGQLYGLMSFVMVRRATHINGFINLCHQGYLKWIQETIGAKRNKCGSFFCGLL